MFRIQHGDYEYKLCIGILNGNKHKCIERVFPEKQSYRYYDKSPWKILSWYFASHNIYG